MSQTTTPGIDITANDYSGISATIIEYLETELKRRNADRRKRAEKTPIDVGGYKGAFAAMVRFFDCCLGGLRINDHEAPVDGNKIGYYLSGFEIFTGVMANFPDDRGWKPKHYGVLIRGLKSTTQELLEDQGQNIETATLQELLLFMEKLDRKGENEEST